MSLDILSTAKIAAALADFQADMPAVSKNKKAEVPTKSGGKYSYTYADLADVSAQAMPLLRKNGLAFSACPRRAEGASHYELEGLLLHTSGEFLTGSLPLQGSSAQELGSSITYMRRYLLGCMTGLVTDDDDDGALAHGRAAKRPAAKKVEPPHPQEPDPGSEEPESAPMSAKTRATMFALFGDLKIADDDQLPGINHILGTDYPSRGRLTEAEAKQVIAVLRRKKEAA